MSYHGTDNGIIKVISTIFKFNSDDTNNDNSCSRTDDMDSYSGTVKMKYVQQNIIFYYFIFDLVAC